MHHTYREITTQPEAWAQALERVQTAGPDLQALWQESGAARAVFLGCGSTFHLAQAAAALFRARVGRPAMATPGGEAFLYPEVAYPRAEPGPRLLVALSRSGTTTETVRAVEAFRAAQPQGRVLVITNDPASPLARLGHLALAVEAGQEQSVVQTRSFASMYVAAVASILLWAGDNAALDAMQRLPEVGAGLMPRAEAAAQALARHPWRLIFVLGGGPRYGLAAELALKLQETSLTPALAYPFLEFRHGPKSLVDGDTLVVGLVSQRHRAHERAVLDEARAMAATTFALAEGEADLAFHSGLPEAVRGVLYLPPVQLLAYFRAVAQGLNPDRPRNLDAVVALDL